jgi:hypothetical protein
MDRISIKEFAKDRGFVQINKTIGGNLNGYPFVTFITADNKAENVYFSKGGAELVKAGDDFTSVAGKFDVTYATNAEGVTLPKLCRKGGDRVSIDDII